MAAMNDAIRSRPGLMQQPWSVYAVACLVAMVLILGRAYEWNRAIQAFDGELQPKWSPPSPDKVKEPGERFFLDNDPYYWITYARQMVETGNWRIRYTYADNVPYGREVHWSQCVMWLLVGFGYVRHLCTGEPMVQAIEGASIWVNPFLLVLFTIGFSWLISRRMGVAAGVFFALTFATIPDVDWIFHSFRPGHHGLHVASSLGTVLCLVLGGLGWVTKEPAKIPEGNAGQKLKFFRSLQLMDRREAHCYFMAAGVFTGFGLWIGATVQFFTIGAIAVASVMLAFFMPAHQTSEDADYLPELWRTWGRWAALVGIIFYLIEYFPSHMALRLEVNNPLYVVAVFCVGELMVQITRYRLGIWRGGFVDYLKIAMSALGVAVVPLAVLLGPVQWHNMRDIEMSRLHNFILEFYTYLNFSPKDPLESWFFKSYGILPFFLLGALALTGPHRARLYEWAALWVSFFLSLFTLLLTLWQIRWAGLHAAMSVWLMIVVGHIAWRNVLSVPVGSRRIGIAVVLSGLVLIQAVYFAEREFSNLGDICEGRTVPKEFIDAAMKKHLAEGLRAESQGKPLRVLCEADLAPALYYFGGIPTVTSLYWENLQGLHDAVAFFTDQGDAVARRIASERGLTHIIVSGSDKLPAQFNYVATGDMSITDARPTLLARLYPNRSEAPAWIKLDEGLTQIGRREFLLKQYHGIASLHSLMTIYRLDPSGEGQK
jgi:hypothetical protein